MMLANTLRNNADKHNNIYEVALDIIEKCKAASLNGKYSIKYTNSEYSHLWERVGERLHEHHGLIYSVTDKFEVGDTIVVEW